VDTPRKHPHHHAAEVSIDVFSWAGIAAGGQQGSPGKSLDRLADCERVDVRGAVLDAAGMAGLRIFADPLHIAQSEFPPSNWNFTWFGPGHFGTERAQMETWLDHQPGKQLVIVRYWGNHDPFDEWVYNPADIDRSSVIWARDGGSAGDQELIRYYRDRSVWLIEPDQSEPGANAARVSQYPFEESK